MPELIAIDLPGGPAFVDALRQAWDGGNAVLALDQRLAAPAKEALLRALRPARIIGADGEGRLSGALPVEPGDALVVATSGTTSVPKGVVLTHEALAASARAIHARLGVDPARHRWLACLPLSHIGGLSVVCRALLTNASLEVLAGFETAAVQQRSGPDVLVSLVPTALARVDAARFRTVVLGGSATPRDLPPNVVTTYGMTETGSGVVYDGVPLDGVGVRVDDGEIHLRGPMLLRAYRDGTVPLDGDGWLSTGDGGWIDESGRLHVEGRMSDLIITGGENVWPEPVEALLRSHPAVAEAAVAGRPDPEWGQRVVAFVVPAEGRPAPTLDQLRGLVRDGLAAFAAPKELVLLDELPTTAIGKVRRHLLGEHSPPNDKARRPSARGRATTRSRAQAAPRGGTTSVSRMQTEAAILWDVRQDWSVEPIDLDPPKEGEVLVRIAASGMCHSDEHLVTGDFAVPYPVIGGHEGAGVVEQVGPGVTGLAPGDHVVFGFIPACGQCPSCATGHSNLCDVGAVLMIGLQLDGTARHHARGQDVATMACLGTFAHHTVVNQASCVKIAEDIPLDKACLVGCGVPTGWGSAVYAAEVRPGENVAVIGVGGVGSNAVQGARLAGAERIFAIDPVEFKREQARKFGATHTASSVDEALGLVQEETWGRMCDKVICTMGVGDGALINRILELTAKRGRVVVTNIHPMAENSVDLNLCSVTLLEKQIVGTIYGSANIRFDIPKLLELYRQGQVDLDGLVTRTYKLQDINQGYQDMRDGKNIRGVLVYD